MRHPCALVGASNALDRNIMGLVLPSIRSEFHVGDAVLGLLSGPAFALTYATCGIPLALLADRVGRRVVIAGALAFFSATTLACGLAGNVWHLAAGRLATGVGEAGTTSPGNALIAGLYAEDRRVAPLSMSAASGYLGLLLAYFGGGWIVEHYGWRAVFLASAAFGGLVLVALGFTAPEPRRTQNLEPRPLRATIASLRTCPGMFWLFAGAAISSIGGYAASAFVPSFLARSHHMSPSPIGFTLATLFGTFGWAGVVAPGLVAQRLRPSDPGFALALSGFALLLTVPSISYFTSPPTSMSRSRP